MFTIIPELNLESNEIDMNSIESKLPAQINDVKKVTPPPKRRKKVDTGAFFLAL